MKIRRMVILNIVLLILIILSTIAIMLFNDYLYAPYDVFNDLREFEHKDALDIDEIPEVVIKNGNTVIEEYYQALKNKDIKNIEYRKTYTTLNLGSYVTTYILVDTEKNKVIENINLSYKKSGELEILTTDYREFNDEDFLLYNDCLVNLKTLNLSPETIEKISKYSEEKPKDNWNIGSNYKYEYSYREPSEYFYTRTKESRWVYIKL